MSGDAAPVAALAEALSEHRPARLAVAVSGGGDSMALLRLAADWSRENRVPVSAVTVDHGLRPESAEEAAFVGRACADLGISHDILKWEGWEGRGNLQAEARRARHRLISGWAQGRGVDTIALGHTADDQAETFLLRLARGSGVDGLAAMKRRRVRDGLVWLRPLLGVRRQALRAYLLDAGAAWIEDPSNDDARFGRVRARQALDHLAGSGITVEGLNDTASRMAMARGALEWLAAGAARDLAQVSCGDVLLRREGFADYPRETQLRLLAQALVWVSSAEYRPRLSALTEALAAAQAGDGRSLHGCLLLPEQDLLRITREFRAVSETATPTDALWDRRWRLSGPHSADLELRALGPEGLLHCPGRHAATLPRQSLIASPAVWRGDTLVAAPLAEFANGWRAELAAGAESFTLSLLSH